MSQTHPITRYRRYCRTDRVRIRKKVGENYIGGKLAKIVKFFEEKSRSVRQSSS